MHILSSFPSICFHLVLPAILIATPTLTAKGRSSHGEIADIHLLTKPEAGGGPTEGGGRRPLGSTRASPSGDAVPDGTTLTGIASPTTREWPSSFGNDSSVVVSATEGGEGKSGIPEMGMGPPIPVGVPHGSLEGDTKGVREGDDRQHRKKARGGDERASTGRVLPHHRLAAGPGRTSSEDSDRQEPTESLRPAAAGQVGVDSGRLHTSQDRKAVRSDSTQTGDVGKHLHLTADGGEPPGVDKPKTEGAGLVGQGVVSGLVQPAVASNDSQSPGHSVTTGSTDNAGVIGVDGPSRGARVDRAVGTTQLPSPPRRLRPTTAYEGPSEVTHGGGESPKEDSVTTPSGLVDGPSVKSDDTITTLREPLHHSQDENMHGGVVKAEEAVVGPVEGGVGSHHLPSGEVAMRSFIAVTVLTLLLVAAVIGSFVCTKDSLQVRRSRYDATRHGVRKVNIPSPGKRYNLVQPLSAITTTVQQGAAASSSSSSYAGRRF